MILTLLVLLLGLFQATACDSGGNSDPDIRGVWTGTTLVPNAPFEIAIHYRIEISDEGLSGTGVYMLETTFIFRTTQVTVTGEYDYPALGMDIVSDDGRADVFFGLLDEAGRRLVGHLTMEPLLLPELSQGGVFTTLGGEADIIFTRVSG